MIKFLQTCYIYQDNGDYCGDGCCWNAWWESEKYEAGEEIDDENLKYDLNSLTEEEDYIRI